MNTQHLFGSAYPRKDEARGLFRTITLLWAITLLACAVMVLLPLGLAHAAPAAGTTIGNQASATYSDASLVTRTVTSNAVVTVVQQVASVSLGTSSNRTISIGGQVQYPHTVTNTGNGTDTFTLSQGNTGNFSFAPVAYYADANGDGVPDNNTAITSTGQLAAGAQFRFVAVGTVPGTAIAGNTNTLTVTATSVFNGAVSATNTDVTTVTAQAVVAVTQSLDVTSGPSPGGPRTITITYTNTGNTTATNLTLADAIPSGMTYVAGSARWSGTGATVLTDANSADSQSGIVYDYNVTTAGRATAVIASLPAGASGTVSFQVNVNAGLAAGAHAATALTATYAYNDGSSTLLPSNTNTVQYTVAASAAVSISSDTVASAAQGATISFTNTVTNGGNGTDTFNLSTGTSTFPAGTTFQFYRADGVTPMVDSSGDGIRDTGPVAAAGTYAVVVRAVLPPGSTGGAYTVQVIATSTKDATKTATGVDTLTAITTSTVDVTNNTAGGPGVGAGPEGAAVVTNTVNPGVATRFTLVVANSSSVADSFNLQASTDSSFATTVLPAGWTVVFRDTNGAVIANTGVINSGANRTVYADVTPGATSVGTHDVYFRVISPSTGTLDRVRDAVTVNTVRSMTVTPSNTGQVTSGGVTVFSHTITNTGNVLEGDVAGSTVAVASLDSTPGFTSIVYWDRNNDGVLDASDPVLTTLAALTGGTNGASTAAGLAAGESATVFVKVIAPPGATVGTSNTTTLSFTTTGVISGVAAPSVLSVADSVNVIASQVTLVKQQALDADCNGVADGSFTAGTITTGAIPGACVRYEITATNAGGTDIADLVVSDATPVSTTYHATVAAASTVGSVSAPANGVAGTVQATVGTLTPTQTAILTFGVRIDP